MLESRSISSAYRKPHTCWQHRHPFTEGMTQTAPPRARVRRSRSTILAALIVASAAFLGYQSWGASASSATPRIAKKLFTHRPHGIPPLGRNGSIGKTDGVVPDG